MVNQAMGINAKISIEVNGQEIKNHIGQPHQRLSPDYNRADSNHRIGLQYQNTKALIGCNDIKRP